MKSYADLLIYGEEYLLQSGIEDAAFEAREIVMYASKLDRSVFALHLCDEVMQECEVQVQNMLDERVKGQPLQYVLGEWDFYGNSFLVVPGVLIPRPETEELTDMAVRYIIKNNSRIVYDVCSGTGCIGLSVAIECPDVHVYLFELYDKPLQCIRANVEKLHLSNVSIIQCDALNPNLEQLPLADVLISNPPYIPAAELHSLQAEVLREPLTALNGGEDGLMFYRALSSHWYSGLKPDGRLFFECAENQPQLIVDLFTMQHPDLRKACCLKDFYGLDRFVVIEK